MSQAHAEGQNQGSSQGQEPAFKRRRVALACKACRNRKTRCNGDRPTCTSCVELGLTCLYEQPAEPDRSQPASLRSPVEVSYDQRLAAIESTLRLLVDNSPGTARGPVDAPVPLPESQVGDEGLEGDDDHVDGMASVAGREQHAAAARYFGPSSNIAFLETITRATWSILNSAKTPQQFRSVAPDPSNYNGDFFVPPPSPPKMSKAYTPGSSSGILVQPTAIDPYAFPAPATMSQLLDTFLTKTMLFYPFLYEPSVRRHAAAALAGPRSVPDSVLCLLNAIFAMATQLNEIISSADGSPSSPSSPPSSVQPHGAETYYLRAKTLLAKLRSPSLERVQCLLLLSQYRRGTQFSSEETCTLHAQAVRLATQMGLHLRSSRHLQVTSLERELRRRTWLNCILQDRILAWTFGWPVLIANADVDIQYPLLQTFDSLVDDGSPSPSEQQRDHQGTVNASFEATLKLYMILGDIMSQLYRPNADRELSLPQILQTSLSLDRELLIWRNSLPKELCHRPWLASVENSDLVSAKLSAGLHLRYLSVRILVDRATLEWFLRSATQEAPPASEMHFVEMAKITLGKLQSNASAVIDTIWRLSDKRHMLGAWWFSAYYLLNSSLVAFACLIVRTFILPEMQSDFVQMSFPFYPLHALVATIRRSEAAATALFKKTDRAKRLQGTLSRLVQRAQSIVDLMPAEDVYTEQSQDSAFRLPDSGVDTGMWDGQALSSLRVETMIPFLDSRVFEGLESMDIMTSDDFGTFLSD